MFLLVKFLLTLLNTHSMVRGMTIYFHRTPYCGLIFTVVSLLFGMIVPASGKAELYKYVKNGTVHYSNVPPGNQSYTVIGKSSISALEVIEPKRRIIRGASRSESSQSTSLSSSVPYLDLIQQIARAYDLNPELVKAVIKIESNFNPKAVSPKGAKGLMQLMPATAKRFGVDDVFDPEENIRGGAKYLAFLFDEFGEQNLDLVLAGYNAGEQAVHKYGKEIPPYQETQQYVKKVKAVFLARSRYRRTHVTSIYKYVGKDGVISFTNIPRAN